MSASDSNQDKSISLSQKVEKSKSKSKNYTMDLRIHSPASLGYLGVEGLDTAPALVRLAQTKGLDVIAITDFCSGSYIDRVISAAEKSDLTVIPGVELRCTIANCADVSITALFPESFRSSDIEDFLRDMDIPVEAALKPNYQVQKPFREIVDAIERRGGVAVPTRMDKTPLRMQAIPTLVEEYGFRTFDLAYADSAAFFKSRWPKTKFHLFSFSSAKALAQIGSRTAKIKLETPGFEGIKSVVARNQTKAGNNTAVNK